GQFRGCYLEGFLRNAKLSGRVTTKIVLARDGHVLQVEDASSDLPDKKVVACVQDAFRGIMFPSNDTGWITVIYPINFRPLGEDEEAPPPPPQRLDTKWRMRAGHLLASTILGGGDAYEPSPPPPPPVAWTGAYAWFRKTLEEAGPSTALVVAAR